MLVEGALVAPEAGATTPACFVSLSGADGGELLLKEPAAALPGYGDALASYAEPLRPSSDSSSSSEHAGTSLASTDSPSPRPASMLLMEREPQRGPSTHDGADASTSGATENVPVFVMLPLDTVNADGIFRYAGAPWFASALHLLAACGVHGVAVDVWWGAVERAPRAYSWGGYRQLFEMVRAAGLRMQVVLSFHACGGNVGDAAQIPLPRWVLDVGASDPDIFFTDRPRPGGGGLGRRNRECVSLFAATAPVLAGRSALQCYSELMAAFRDAFAADLGGLIEEVVVGMGPCGELRYPSYVEAHGWRFPGVGEFVCYDRYALASLAAAAREAGRPEWGCGGPHDAGSANSAPGETPFFASRGGGWSGEYGRFFLGWYSGELVAHGERLLAAAARVFGPHLQLQRRGSSCGGGGAGAMHGVAGGAQALLRRISTMLSGDSGSAGGSGTASPKVASSGGSLTAAGLAAAAAAAAAIKDKEAAAAADDDAPAAAVGAAAAAPPRPTTPGWRCASSSGSLAAAGAGECGGGEPVTTAFMQGAGVSATAIAAAAAGAAPRAAAAAPATATAVAAATATTPPPAASPSAPRLEAAAAARQLSRARSDLDGFAALLNGGGGGGVNIGGTHYHHQHHHQHLDHRGLPLGWPPAHNASYGSLSLPDGALPGGGVGSIGGPPSSCADDSPVPGGSAHGGSHGLAALLGGVAGMGAGALQGLVAAAAAATAGVRGGSGGGGAGANAASGALSLSIKVAGVHWWYNSASHASELTAGYYNLPSEGRDGYAPILAACARHGVGLTLTCVEMCDAQHVHHGAGCGPEGLLRQVRARAAQLCVPVAGENALPMLGSGGVDAPALQRVVLNTRGGRRSAAAAAACALRPAASWPGTGCAALNTAAAADNGRGSAGGGGGSAGGSGSGGGGNNAAFNSDGGATAGGGGGGGGGNGLLPPLPPATGVVTTRRHGHTTTQPRGAAPADAAGDALPPMRAFTFLRLGPELLQPSHRLPFAQFMAQMTRRAPPAAAAAVA